MLVLAAGLGARYGGLKQIDSFGPSGETIIDYSIHDALQAGFGKLVFVIGHHFEEDFKAKIGRKFEARVPVGYAFQELENIPEGCSVPPGRERPWGTGHAVLVAEDLVDEPFAVINADDFYGAESFRLLGRHLASMCVGARPGVSPEGRSTFSMVGFVLRQTLSDFGVVARGVCVLDGRHRLCSITERTGIERNGQGAFFTNGSGQVQTLTGDEIVSMNMWGFPPSIFRHLREQFVQFMATYGTEVKAEFYLPTVVDNLIRDGRAEVQVLATRGSWFGVTHRQDKPTVDKCIQNLIEQGLYRPNLWGD